MQSTVVTFLVSIWGSDRVPSERQHRDQPLRVQPSTHIINNRDCQARVTSSEPIVEQSAGTNIHLKHCLPLPSP